jgi:hypothetical protein
LLQVRLSEKAGKKAEKANKQTNPLPHLLQGSNPPRKTEKASKNCVLLKRMRPKRSQETC